MNCPDCASRLLVWDSHPSPEGGTARELRCLCGGRFLSLETIARRLSPLGTGTPPVPHGYPAGTRVGNRYPTGTPPVPSRGPPPGTRTPPVPNGGVGGGLSGDRSGSGPDPSPTSPGDPNRVRARSTKRAPPDPALPTYPDVFEELWVETGRRGGKDDAFKAWVKWGRWPWRQIKPAWEAYLRSERPVAGFVKDLSSWLNGRGHQQEWPPAGAAPVTREERERAAARERDRIASERRIAETNAKLAAERALKARLDAQAAAGGPAAPPVDIRGQVAALAQQKSAPAVDEDAEANEARRRAERR